MKFWRWPTSSHAGWATRANLLKRGTRTSTLPNGRTGTTGAIGTRTLGLQLAFVGGNNQVIFPLRQPLSLNRCWLPMKGEFSG